ncbi:MAG: HAD family hydrolase [Betaproteobacteria bacterium]|jgi:FMN hydrolase / 5-amino-6-(5-phospho-D-ribitylamino)uracil phosphatase|nr:HAD family hydrolase [Betaproteobacteria bacterium]NBT69433.1 HAD family hydrolase [Betaproteobacteria bacterium]NBY08046.1 HAD family hydrolase [Betaproteobacteria bacterium]
MINTKPIRAITLDLDDTLWPVWPTIRQADSALQAWLKEHAPLTAVLCSDTNVTQRIRSNVNQKLSHLAHDLSALRLESIRQALLEAGEDTHLAEPAFEVFFSARQQVTFFNDALPALESLSAMFPLIALSNGNADIHRVGIEHFFQASISARDCGFAKPDPRIFWQAAQFLKLEPHEILHVGDDAALDILGARKAGLPCVWLNRDAVDWAHHPEDIPAQVSTLTDLVNHLLAR